jgi:hypothetical protein
LIKTKLTKFVKWISSLNLPFFMCIIYSNTILRYNLYYFLPSNAMDELQQGTTSHTHTNKTVIFGDEVPTKRFCLLKHSLKFGITTNCSVVCRKLCAWNFHTAKKKVICVKKKAACLTVLSRRTRISRRTLNTGNLSIYQKSCVLLHPFP